MTESAILYSATDGLATITINRAEVLNAFTPAALDELHASLRRATDESQRAILLTGAGRGFSAGMDLASIKDDYAGGGPDFDALLSGHFHPVVRAIRSAPVPVVAAVNGVAAGAGMSLALACDVRLAAENARFATAFTRIGLVPDCGMAYTLPRLVGPGRASFLLLSGEQVDAAAALAMGLVDRVLPAEGFLEAATTFARALASGPTRAFALTKLLLAEAEHASFDDLLRLEAKAQVAAGETADHRNAVAAFLEKRQATFEGR